MMIAALIFAITSPALARQRQHVEVLELNHVLRDDGDVQFSQIILWRWAELMPTSRHVVSEWFLVDEEQVVIDSKHGFARVTWRGKGGVCFEATCRTFRETRTHYDPEMLDRRILNTELRRPYFPKQQER